MKLHEDLQKEAITMKGSSRLFESPLRVINVGLDVFYDDFQSQGTPVMNVDWTPPPQGKGNFLHDLQYLHSHMEKIEEANKKAIEHVLSADPVWVDVQLAKDAIPGFTENTISHAGPPISWENMCGPMKGAIIATIMYEGKATNVEEAKKVAASGEFRFVPNHELQAVGPMTGIISANMPVIVVENKADGNVAYSSLPNDGVSFGDYGEDTLEMLHFIKEVMGPLLGATIRKAGGINLKNIIAKAIHMGDECHNRLVAATSLLWRELAPFLNEGEVNNKEIAEVANLLTANDWFFLNYSMAVCKATMDAARNIPNSTLVTAMARNGVEVGLQVSGLGNQWFTAKSPHVKGIYLPGFTKEDANPDLGDSAITETAGIGAFAIAAALPMTQLVGGTIYDAIGITKTMGEITIAESKAFTIPLLEYLGTPTGIDVLKVVETGIQPKIDTGIAHKEAGHGMVGAGIAEFPMEAFIKSIPELRKSIDNGEVTP